MCPESAISLHWADPHPEIELIEQLTDGPIFEWSTGNVALMIISSLSSHASPIGLSPGNDALSKPAKCRPPQSRY